MQNKILPVIVLIGLAAWFGGCEKGTIEDIGETNPEAIIRMLTHSTPAIEAHDPDFLDTSDWYEFSEPLSGGFVASALRLSIDSLKDSIKVVIGDSTFLDGVGYVKEAEATAMYRIFYKLLIRDTAGEQLEKHFRTEYNTAAKRAYVLQLDRRGQIYRGWYFWSTYVPFKLTNFAGSVTWRSDDLGEQNISETYVMRTELTTFQPGDSVTVRYSGGETDVAFLNIDELGRRRRIPFLRRNAVLQEAGWTVSSGLSTRTFYYAGIDVYRGTTLTSRDPARVDVNAMGLMYRIGD